jgi:phage terminase small subunit
MAKLTAKQQRFCDEYLVDLNATQAAIRAGYSKKFAGQNADKILKNTNVKEYIKTRMDEKEKELIADQDEILRYLTAVMRGTETDEQYVVGAEGGVEKIPVRKQVNQLKAAEMLAKRYGLLVDKMEVDADMEMTINVRRV